MLSSVKQCSACSSIKPLSEFYEQRRTGGHRSQCKACEKLYQTSNTVWKLGQKKSQKKSQNAIKARLIAFIKTQRCCDCGESNPIVLEFDHNDPATKRCEVTKMAKSYGWPAIEAEIAKCSIRCANCHRIRTARQFGWDHKYR